MKKITATKMIKKALGATLAAVIAMGSAFVAMPVIHTHAAEENAAVKSVQTESVDIALGLSGLRDPMKKTSDSGDSYVPSDYIYLGNNNRGAMLWRVLSSNTDNLGNPGATFVMSEYLEAASLAGKNYDEAYLSYFTDTEKAVFLPYASEESGSSTSYGKEWTEKAPMGVLFAPSASDVANYVANYSGAPTLRAYTDASRATAGNWWLRSQADGGVGYVTAAGVVDTETNLGLISNYNRLAANLDISNVVFSTKVDGGWRLAVLDEKYDVPVHQYDFAAWITDINGNDVKISYVNAKPKDVSDEIGEYISAIVTDADGNVKHYSQMGEVNYTEEKQWPGWWDADDDGTLELLSPATEYPYHGSVHLDLSSGVFDYAAGDKIYVFWEKAYSSRDIDSNPSLAYQTTTASKLVEVCWHEADTERPATCTRFDTCIKCGTEFGGYNFTDINAHVDDDGISGIKWEQWLGEYVGEDGFFRDGWLHRGFCELCKNYVPMDEDGYQGFSEPCYCEGAEEINCTDGAICDACGGHFVDPEVHSFDRNGICDQFTHFEKPVLADGTYRLSKIGHLIWYGNYVNSFVDQGDMYGAVLMNDIDFSILSEYESLKSYTWMPMGLNDPYNATFDGAGFEIKNLKVAVGEGDNRLAAFIARGQGSEIKNLGFSGAQITNTAGGDQAYSAVLMAYGDDENTITNCYVKSSSVSGKQNVGGLVSVLTHGDGMSNCYAIDLTLRENGGTVYSWIARYASAGVPSYCFAYGENAGVLGEDGSGFHMGTHINKGYRCYYLDADGTLDSDESRKTAEQFESGLVAYYLGSSYGQMLGDQSYPVLNGDTVYRVEICGGEGIDKYTYSNTDTLTHVWDNVHACGTQKTCTSCGEKFGDVLEHEYTSIKGNESFIWTGSYSACSVQTYCKYCGEENPELLSATVNFNFNGGVRADYVASIHLGEEVYSSDVVRIPIITIDEATGITPSCNIFTGLEYSAYDLVTNTKMQPGEYDAYFLLDGEMVGEYARDAGVYDLYIVGRGRYDYQTYTYEDFFTIEKVKVEMTVSVKDKIVDGRRDYEFELSFSGEIDYSDIIGIEADQNELPSWEVGEYEITGIDFYFYYGDENNITITHNDTAIARVLPRNYVEIFNESYELNYEYGEKVPEPKASDFTVDEGSELTFAWFKDGVFLNGVPQKAGTYILRVSASATDEYIGSVAEYTVTVQPKLLEIVIDPYGECETEIEDLGYDWDDDGKNDTKTWYFVEMGETVPLYVVGLVGIDEPVPIDDERFTSTGYYLYWRRYRNGAGVHESEGDDYSEQFPKIPNTDGYRMDADTRSENSFGVSSDAGFAGNYAIELYVKVQSPIGEVKPVQDTVEYDGDGKQIEAVITIPRWDITLDGYDGMYGFSDMAYITLISYDPDIEENYFYRDGTSTDLFTQGFPVQTIEISKSGVLYISVTASYKIYGTDFEGEKEVMRAKLTVTITNADGDAVDEIREIGTYTVTVKTEPCDESGNVTGEGAEHSTTYRVKRAPRDIYMLVKETEVILDGDLPEYDEKDIVFLIGYTLAPGHKIADLTYNIELGGYVGAFNMGIITVKDWVIVDENGNDVSDEYVIHSKLYEWEKKYKEIYGRDFENTKNHTVVHAYSNACDATCNIDYCTKMREVEPHKGGIATCTTLAICEVCGSEYGGYDYSNHSGTKTVYLRNPDDFRYHDQAYACCGTVISTESHTITKAATCTTLAECKLCGVVQGSYDATNHSSEEMYYATNPDDATKHDYMHKCCDAVESTGEHKGGVATCTSLAVCDVCELGYGELDADNHSSEDYKYTVIADGATRHDVRHACCGVYVGAENHFGGEANCASGALCEGCGAEYGNRNPENHASDEYRYSPASVGNKHYVYNSCCGAEVKSEEHSGGHATCENKATCQKCGVEYGETDPTAHASDDISYTVNAKDPTKHDAVCKSCGALVETAAHSGGEATCTSRAECELCKVSYGELGAHTYTNPCDADCDACGAERLPGHVDADKDRYCDLCEKELYAASDESESESETESETESGSSSEIESEDVSESESEDESETESDDVTETETEDTESGTQGGNDGGKKGCKSSICASALTVTVSVTLAGFTLVKRKKEN